RVGAQYFAVLGTRIVMGRSFGPQDRPQSQRVAVINETLARKLYPEASPLGRHFALAERDKLEIVGVVKDAKYHSVRETPRGMWFVYAEQEQPPIATMTWLCAWRVSPRRWWGRSGRRSRMRIRTWRFRKWRKWQR